MQQDTTIFRQNFPQSGKSFQEIQKDARMLVRSALPKTDPKGWYGKRNIVVKAVFQIATGNTSLFSCVVRLRRRSSCQKKGCHTNNNNNHGEFVYGKGVLKNEDPPKPKKEAKEEVP